MKHDNILKYIFPYLDRERFRVNVDIDGHRTREGGTVPNDLLVTEKRPDIVVVDDKKKILEVLELVVPLYKAKGRWTKKMKYKNHFTTNRKKHKKVPSSISAIFG